MIGDQHYSLMSSIAPFASQLIAGLITIFIAISTYYIRPRVKLVYGRANNSYHILKPNDVSKINVYCEKFYINNLGRKAAESVDITLSPPPSELSIFPSQKFSISKNPEGAVVISFDYLAAKDLIIIDTIHVDVAPSQILSVKSKESSGKKVEFWVVRKFSNYAYGLLYAVIALGVFKFIELIIKFFY